MKHIERNQRTFIPPQKVANEAAYGLYLRSQMAPSNRCCTAVGLARAKQLKNREPVSVDTLKRMRSYFQRHEVDKQGRNWGVSSKGYQAWLLWGGDSGRDWANRILDELGESATANPSRRSRRMIANARMSSGKLQKELLHLLNAPVDAYDFFPYIAEYAEEVGLDPDDPYGVADDPEAAKAFMKWVEANDIHGRWMREDPTSVPPKFTFSDARPLPEGTWLIHHSDADIDEFDRGATYERLGLSTWFGDKQRRGRLNLDDELSPIERVYVFAFEPSSDPAISRFGLPLASGYGENWYLFRSDAAVAAYHNDDQQWQVIFPAGTEYDLMRVSIDDGATWSADVMGERVEGDTFDEFLGNVEAAL